jgi:dTDP-4-dehydrorhamnose reductase
MKKKIVFTGGSGRFGSIIKTVKSKYKLLFPTKRELNITNLEKIRKYLKKYKPDYVVHMAGLSRPMQIHEKKNKFKYFSKYYWHI